MVLAVAAVRLHQILPAPGVYVADTTDVAITVVAINTPAHVTVAAFKVMTGAVMLIAPPEVIEVTPPDVIESAPIAVSVMVAPAVRL